MKMNAIQIVSALIWAGSIIACSTVLEGSANEGLIRNILITGASIHFLLLSEKSHSSSVKNENSKL